MKGKHIYLQILFILKLYFYSSLTGGAYWKVMLQSGKYDLVHEFFRKMKRSEEALRALTYRGSFIYLFIYFEHMYWFCVSVEKVALFADWILHWSVALVLVKAFWEEGKINEAVEAVRHIEQRGVIGMASVFYELACCLRKNGRWQEFSFAFYVSTSESILSLWWL